MATEERKNILVITLSNIGDVILTTPVITSLRSTFPRARMTVVVGPKAEGVLKGSRQIDRLLVYDKEAGWPHKLELVRALREEFYDWVVDLRNSAFPFLVRAERRSPIFRSYRLKSARERHLEILRMMKLDGPSPVTFDFFSKENELSLLEKLKRKGINHAVDGVVVAPGAGSEAKQWRIEGFCEVVRGLSESTSLSIFAVGDKKETSLGAKLSEVDLKRVVNLAGELTLRELAALISCTRLVLTNDSACMHLGYELQRPVVAVFGPTDETRYGRRNEIWRIVRASPPSGFQELSSGSVLHACEELLQDVSVGQRH